MNQQAKLTRMVITALLTALIVLLGFTPLGLIPLGWCNVTLYVICGIVIQSWILPLYSIVTYAAALKTVDFIVEGLDRAKCAIIVTTSPTEICATLCQTFETGVTRVEARGGYSNTDKTMLYFIVNRFQVARMRDIVHEIDPGAYIIINEVADVFSNTKREEP